MASLPRDHSAPTATGRGRLSKEERRDALLDMAAEIAVRESVGAVSMELVAERCGVSRPLVYKHFANRDEMLGALYRREARRLHRELASEVAAAGSVEEMFELLARGALRAAASRGDLFTTLRRAGAWSREVRREQRGRDEQTARAFVRRAVQELELDPQRGPTVVSLLLSMIDHLLDQWRRDPSEARAERLVDGYMTVVRASLEALASPAPDRG